MVRQLAQPYLSASWTSIYLLVLLVHTEKITWICQLTSFICMCETSKRKETPPKYTQKLSKWKKKSSKYEVKWSVVDTIRSLLRFTSWKFDRNPCVTDAISAIPDFNPNWTHGFHIGNFRKSQGQFLKSHREMMAARREESVLIIRNAFIAPCILNNCWLHRACYLTYVYVTILPSFVKHSSEKGPIGFYGLLWDVF